MSSKQNGAFLCLLGRTPEMSIDDVISLKSRSWKRGGEGGRGRTLDQWSFEKQVAGLSLAQYHLDIPDKQFINCICIDPCSNQ